TLDARNDCPNLDSRDDRPDTSGQRYQPVRVLTQPLRHRLDSRDRILLNPAHAVTDLVKQRRRSRLDLRHNVVLERLPLLSERLRLIRSRGNSPIRVIQRIAQVIQTQRPILNSSSKTLRTLTAKSIRSNRQRLSGRLSILHVVDCLSQLNAGILTLAGPITESHV